jgi:hypothetical protein
VLELPLMDFLCFLRIYNALFFCFVLFLVDVFVCDVYILYDANNNNKKLFLHLCRIIKSNTNNRKTQKHQSRLCATLFQFQYCCAFENISNLSFPFVAMSNIVFVFFIFQDFLLFHVFSIVFFFFLYIFLFDLFVQCLSRLKIQ